VYDAREEHIQKLPKVGREFLIFGKKILPFLKIRKFTLIPSKETLAVTTIAYHCLLLSYPSVTGIVLVALHAGKKARSACRKNFASRF